MAPRAWPTRRSPLVFALPSCLPFARYINLDQAILLAFCMGGHFLFIVSVTLCTMILFLWINLILAWLTGPSRGVGGVARFLQMRSEVRNSHDGPSSASIDLATKKVFSLLSFSTIAWKNTHRYTNSKTKLVWLSKDMRICSLSICIEWEAYYLLNG